MTNLVIPGNIQKLRPYIPGKPIEDVAREKKIDRIVKLASNENPCGPSPKGIEAVKEYLSEVHRYPNPAPMGLLEKLADRLGVEWNQILLGNGADSILGYTILAFTKDGDEVLTSEGTFIGMYLHTLKNNRTLKQIPLKNWTFDLQGIQAAITEKTKIIYIANPNNPTGTYAKKDELESFLKSVPKEILVVLDEAYFEYAKARSDYPDGVKLLSHENLLITRTFSKAYGLAGLRVGYAVANADVIREMTKVRLTFEPSGPSSAGAFAALDDKAFLSKTIQANDHSLARLRESLEGMGISCPDSAANFLMMDFENEEKAKAFASNCLDQGLILRQLSSFGIPQAVRMNSGTEEETDFALEVITKVRKGAK